MSPTSAIYWLSTNKRAERKGRADGLEATGTFPPSRDKGKTGTIKTNFGRRDG